MSLSSSFLHWNFDNFLCMSVYLPFPIITFGLFRYSQPKITVVENLKKNYYNYLLLIWYRIKPCRNVSLRNGLVLPKID